MAVQVGWAGEPAAAGLAPSAVGDLVIHVGGNGRVIGGASQDASDRPARPAGLASPAEGDALLSWLAEAVGPDGPGEPGGAVLMVVRRDPRGPGLLVAARRLAADAAGELGRPRRAAATALPRRLVGFKRKRTFLFDPAQVLAFELRSGLVHATFDGGESYTTNYSIREVAERLAPLGFFRVHRDVVVNLKRVKEIEKLGQGRVRLLLDTPDAAGLHVSRPASARLRRLLRF